MSREEKKPTGLSMASQEPLVSIPTAGLAISDEPVTTLYHVGTQKGCPFHNVTVGGICFPEFTEEVKHNAATQQTDRSRKVGDILPLTDAEATRVKDAISKRVIRWAGAEGRDEKGDPIIRRGFIRLVSDSRFRKMPGDEPLGKYLYMDMVSPDALQASMLGRPLA